MGSAASIGVIEWDASVFPKHGIKASYLKEFIEEIGGREKLIGKTTTDVCTEFLKPLTEKSQSSLCDLLRHMKHEAFGKKAEVFISHAWRYDFLDVVDALLYHFRDQPDTVIWFDLVSNNQHKATTLDYDWWQTTFKSAIADFQHTVMVLSPWHDPIPYTRAWCIFEAYCSASTNCKFEIAMCEKEQTQFLKDIDGNVDETINKMLATIDARKSESYSAEDRDKIFSVITDTVGFNRINSMVFEQFRDWVIEICDNHYQDLQQELGDTHPDTLRSMSNLASLYTNQGKNDLAEPLFVSCLDMRKTALGETHPDTLTSMNNMASLYKNQGKYDLAEPLYVSCLDMRKTELGENHAETLGSMNNLALLYNKQGKYDLAERLHVSSLKMKKDALGDSHPDTLVSMNNLASLYKNLKKFDLSEPLYVSCLDMKKDTLGETHPSTLTAMNNLASLYKKQGKYDLAEPLYKSCLNMRKTALGDTHPDTLASLNNLASLYKKQGKNDLAEPLHVSCLELAKVILGDTHPDTLTAMNNLAMLYKNLGKYDLAEPLYVSCLEMKKTTLGDNHPSTLISKNNLEHFYEEQTKQ